MASSSSSLASSLFPIRPINQEYFNDMGMLAVEGTYSKMEALLDLINHPVNILSMLAATVGDRPKIEEVLRGGAVYSVRMLMEEPQLTEPAVKRSVT